MGFTFKDVRRQYHLVFMQRSGNHRLMPIRHDLKLSCQRVELTYVDVDTSGKYSVDEHYRILQALQQGDLEQSRTMIRFNWQSRLQRLQELAARKQSEKNKVEIFDDYRF